MRHGLKTLALCSCLVSTLGPPPAWAEEDKPAEVEIRTVPVRGPLQMIEGVKGFAGGNVGVSFGPDGLFLVDDELQAMAPKLRQQLATISKQPVRFVVNTHWHGDHSGGNAALAASGSVVVAHKTVRERLTAAEAEKTASKAGRERAGGGLPIVTFDSDIVLHLNGDDIHLIHVDPAHTDGDVLVHFEQTNVIHTGDLFLSSGYPYVDLGSGGNYAGFIAAADKILALSNARTIIIPGHGSLAKPADVRRWRNALSSIGRRVQKLIASGKTLKQTIAAKPTADWDEKMGSNFISADSIVEAAYRSMTRRHDHDH